MGKRIACCLSTIFLTSLMLMLSACGDPAVADAIKAIDSIGEVTIESELAIEEANKKYEALDDEQKAEVENYEDLENANTRLDEVKNEVRCVDVIASGLMFRLDAVDQSTDSFSAHAVCTSEAVQHEKEGIESILDLQCGDNFNALVADYASSLSSQIEGLAGYPEDATLYNDCYVDQGVKKQIECIESLVDQYGLEVDDAHKRMLSDFLQSNLPYLANPGEELEVFTENGDVRIAFDGFVVDGQNTDRAIEFGEITDGQEYGSLLITIDNVSYSDSNINGGMGTYVNTDDVFYLCGTDGAAIGMLNSSWGYPGYEFASNFIDINQGMKKRIEITYAIDAGSSELGIVLSSGNSVILPVERI